MELQILIIKYFKVKFKVQEVKDSKMYQIIEKYFLNQEKVRQILIIFCFQKGLIKLLFTLINLSMLIVINK